MRPKLKLKILIVPGLNLNPNQMQCLVQSLSQHNYDSKILKLPGIGLETKDEVTYELWLETLRIETSKNEYCALIGFSLGGLLISHLNLSSQKKYPLILFAPAIKIKPTSWLPFYLFKIPFMNGLISAQKKDFLVYRITPKALYNSLYIGIKQFNQNFTSFNDSPALFFFHKNDELVDTKSMIKSLKSISGTKKIIVNQLDFKPRLGHFLNHLCFHRKNMKEIEYDEVINKMAHFLDTYSK